MGDDLGRAHDGPAVGTYVIAIEIPPEIDPEKAHALETALSAVAKKCIPGAFTSGYRVRESQGKHGVPKGSQSN